MTIGCYQMPEKIGEILGLFPFFLEIVCFQEVQIW